MYRIVFVIFFFALTRVVLAQTAECPAIAQTILAQVDSLCNNLGRNQVCYGGGDIDVTFIDGTENVKFDTAGDRVNIDSISNISIKTINTNFEEVPDSLSGMIILNLQANLPNTLPGQSVTFLVAANYLAPYSSNLDDALILPEDYIQLSTTVESEVRFSPNNEAGIGNPIEANVQVLVDGISSDGQWLRIRHFRHPVSAWIPRHVIENVDLLSQLPSISYFNAGAPSTLAYALTTNIAGVGCDSVPSTLSIRTPEGTTIISFNTNGVEVNLG